MSLPISNPRAFVLLLCGTLAACGEPSGEPEGTNIDCAIGPGSEFANVCVVEALSPGQFVIHHPDGGFRRFSLSGGDGSAIAVSDGAEPVVYEEMNDDTGVLEFGLTVDRYRLDMSAISATAPADE